SVQLRIRASLSPYPTLFRSNVQLTNSCGFFQRRQYRQPVAQGARLVCADEVSSTCGGGKLCSECRGPDIPRTTACERAQKGFARNRQKHRQIEAQPQFIEPRQHRERGFGRSEEHTSELQSRFDLVCRLLLEKKNRNRL